jgi:mRNA-degrading endonuclease toxin of MazEF toxin-antitoxin module
MRCADLVLTGVSVHGSSFGDGVSEAADAPGARLIRRQGSTTALRTSWIVVPITKTKRAIPTHVIVPAGEAGLLFDSCIKCEDLRSISKDRLVRHMGDVAYTRIESVQRYVRLLLGL